MSKNKTARASIHDVARLAGVSAATVSKFLHGVETIKAINVERIRSAIAELGYRVDPLAADMRRAQRKLIGLIVPDLESEFFGKIASRIEILAEQAGYSLSIASSHESEEREAALVERMHDWRMAGTILAPVRSERGAGVEKMKSLGMAGVLVDRVISDTIYDTVSVDNAGASASVCRALTEMGHQHVLLVGQNEVSKNVRFRISGFRDEAAKICPEMRVDVLMADGGVEDLRSKLGSYLDEARPSVVYSLFQKATLVVLTEFRRQGIKCPEEISLVGFDDAEWMQVTYPAVSAVVQPIDEIAVSAFARLMNRLEGMGGAQVSHLESCQISWRDSAKVFDALSDKPEQNINIAEA
jgi:DNA-binding LacI/PurR family transcriptional regulator